MKEPNERANQRERPEGKETAPVRFWLGAILILLGAIAYLVRTVRQRLRREEQLEEQLAEQQEQLVEQREKLKALRRSPTLPPLVEAEAAGVSFAAILLVSLLVLVGSGFLLLILFGGLPVAVTDVLPDWDLFDRGNARGYQRDDLSPIPVLQEMPVEDRLRLTGAELERLGSYGVVSEELDLVHVPIERAIAVIVERGLPTPVPSPTPAPATPTPTAPARASPTPAETDTVAMTITPTPGSPAIPHTLVGREECLSCHGPEADLAPTIPEDHEPYTDDQCQICHER